MPTFSLESRRRAALGLFVGLVFAGVVAGAGAASPALAHDLIVASTPENGEVITEPITTVSMTFSDDILVDAGAVALVTVTDIDDGHHESGCVSIDGKTATTEVALGESGEYLVTWQVVSSDGHPTSGTYTFEWKPSMPMATTTAMTSSPTCGEEWSGSVQPASSNLGGSGAEATPPVEPGTLPASAVPEPTMTILNSAPAGQTDQGGLAVPLLIALIVGVVAALSAVVVVVMRRVRRT